MDKSARVRPGSRGGLVDAREVNMATAWRIRGVDATREATELPVSSRKEIQRGLLGWAKVCALLGLSA